MPSTTDLAQRVWELLTRSTPALLEAYLDSIDNSGNLPSGVVAIRDFSPFDKNHIARAEDVQKELQAALKAGSSEEEGLSRAMDHYESLHKAENPELLMYALQVFLVHYKGSISLAMPSLLASKPERLVPRQVTEDPGGTFPVAEDSEETKLDWFRESPFLNEHHRHWHLVYMPRMQLDRQGEMFFFMHQQMLARYNADRLAEGVDEVKAFDDFSKPIAVGYVPGPDERLGRGLRRRPSSVTLPTADAATLEFARRAIEQDIDRGDYDPEDESMTAETQALNALGSTLEPNLNTDARRSKSYFGYHGEGHLAIAGLNEGVMGSTTTAVRDVVFWEWHKGIDNLYHRLQQRLAPYDFSVDAPPVEFRKSVDAGGSPYSPDIILVPWERLPGHEKPDFDGQAFGQMAFGGINWNLDFGEGTYAVPSTGGQVQTVRTVNTFMRQGQISYRSITGQPRTYPYPYLMHDPICYFLRLQNLSLEIKRITIRMFLCPLEHQEDRRRWIEIDKFIYELLPQSKTVIFRPDTAFSAVRKPVDLSIDPAHDMTAFDPVSIPQRNAECNCGWPYSMLYPKGKTGAGMAFQLAVMVTDADIDLMERESDCGSFSFCAARQDGYPDRRPLGYPFNRPLGDSVTPVTDTIRNQHNMASRSIFIKHT